jgi:hypothetical protein
LLDRQGRGRGRARSNSNQIRNSQREANLKANSKTNPSAKFVPKSLSESIINISSNVEVIHDNSNKDGEG